MYGIYNKNEDVMFLMDIKDLWKYLSSFVPVFQNYSVITDGKTVKIYEPSFGANGKIDDLTLQDFFDGFEEDEGLIIKPIKEVGEIE